MKCTATLKTKSSDAKNITRSLSVDNVRKEKLSVSTRAEGEFIISEIETKSVESMLHTLDDIIFCQITAEESLR
ncbi:MAG: KEOPS complex subunit Pcc1 [Candidatus Altiarchaeota archaeon]